MNRRMQIYFNAVFGGIGALLGWFFVGLAPMTVRGTYFTEAALVGAGSGAFIGAFVGAVDGAVVKQSARRAVFGFGLGMPAGLISGAIGLGAGWLAFSLLNGGFAGRAIGFVIFGALLGVAGGVINRALRRSAYGLLGGTVAGFAAGVLYEAVTVAAFRTLGDTDLTQTVFGALGLVMVGAALGGITCATEDAIGKAVDRGMLIVRTGRRAGQERRIADPVILGSYDGCELYLPGDPGVGRRHARVSRKGRGFVAEPLDANHLLVNGKAVISGGTMLHDHDRLLVGETEVEFRAA